MRVSIQSSTGAAGTIRTVWRAQNISGKACRSFGYPGMDVRGPHGWLNLHVIRGGRYGDINQPPQRIVVAPGHSLYFVSYWVDVTTNTFPVCTPFDRVKVTLPDNRVSNVLSATGLSNSCLNPDSVHVGPVTTRVPGP